MSQFVEFRFISWPSGLKFSIMPLHGIVVVQTPEASRKVYILRILRCLRVLFILIVLVGISVKMKNIVS